MLCAIASADIPQSSGPPRGWIKAGDAPSKYEVGTDLRAQHEGRASGYIRSTMSVTGGFGTLMQTSSADDYRGKRVRMSGWAMTAEVGQWAGLWMRVDGKERHEMLGFDNMQSRPIKGTTPWTRYAIVLDVPKEAEEIAYGILLEGAGEAWLDDLTFEVVDQSVPVTGKDAGYSPPRAPTNLGFEH